jgi:putative endonuclease
MNKTNKTIIGRQAEETACRFLLANGLNLIQKNFRCYFGEIDLIMQDEQDIVFVEVRSRNSLDYGHAQESITTKKMKKIIQTASYFLKNHGYLNKINSRFDVIAIHPAIVNPNAKERQLEWIKNAFAVQY